MKNVIQSLIIFIMFLSTSCAFAAEDSLDKFMQDSILFYQKMALCMPSQLETGPRVIGIKADGCSLYRAYTEYEGKEYPTEECLVPLSVVRSYANKKISELKNGQFIYHANTDELNQYCRNKSVKIKTQYGEINFN